MNILTKEEIKLEEQIFKNAIVWQEQTFSFSCSETKDFGNNIIYKKKNIRNQSKKIRYQYNDSIALNYMKTIA